MRQTSMRTIFSNQILSDCNRILVFFVPKFCVCRRSLRFTHLDTSQRKSAAQGRL